MLTAHPHAGGPARRRTTAGRRHTRAQPRHWQQALGRCTGASPLGIPSAAAPDAMKRKAEDDSVRISKEMSRILRHHPPPGAMDSAGWVSVPVLLKHLKQKPTAEQVKQVVDSCEKVRKERGGGPGARVRSSRQRLGATSHAQNKRCATCNLCRSASSGTTAWTPRGYALHRATRWRSRSRCWSRCWMREQSRWLCT